MTLSRREVMIHLITICFITIIVDASLPFKANIISNGKAGKDSKRIIIDEELTVQVEINWNDSFEVFAMIDSKKITHDTCEYKKGFVGCKFDFGYVYAGAHTIAVYARNTTTVFLAGAPLEIHVQYHHLFIPDLELHKTYSPEASNRSLVGVYYTPYQSYIAQNMQLVEKYTGTKGLTVDDVLKSNGKLILADILDKYNNSIPGIHFDGLLFQSRPQLGFYCLYRKRPGEAGIIPDCPNITQTLEAHSDWLLAAGVDYIAFDGTNWGLWPSNDTDLYQYRPMEVVFEEFYSMRQRGRNTPKLVVWNTVSDPKFTLWQVYLDRIYNNASYNDLFLYQPHTGKKAFWVVSNPVEAIVQQIEYNGGRNDIATLPMFMAWWGYDPNYYNGNWSYLSPCTAVVNNVTQYTTNVLPNRKCAHLPSYNTSFGSQFCVATQYQTVAEALPFNSPGKLNGLTFKKQFEDVFSIYTDHIFIPSFNEFVVGQLLPSHWGFTNKYIRSMGLEHDPYTYVFMDGYASDRSRTLEPSDVDSGYYLDLVASCTRVLLAAREMGVDYCVVSNEECCMIHDNNTFTNIWSLRRSDQMDNIISNNLAEVQKLTGTHEWQEICNAYVGPSDFCVNETLAYSGAEFDIFRGPFEVFETANSLGEVSLWRCVTESAKHLFSTDAACEGLGSAEVMLGYASSARNAVTPRSLHRCSKGNSTWYHTLDGPCIQGDTDDVLAYVI